MTDREKEPDVLDETEDRPRGAEAEDTAGGAAEPDPSDRPEEGDEGGGPEEADELSSLRDEFQSLEDRHLRLAAEFNNFRRRAETERTEAWSRAQAELVGRLIDPLDDLRRVNELDEAAASVEALLEGVEMVERKLLRALREAGAEVVDPDPGDRFEPETMEAMMRVSTEDPDADDTVEAVLQKGYRFRGHLVRPARVSVRKHG